MSVNMYVVFVAILLWTLDATAIWSNIMQKFSQNHYLRLESARQVILETFKIQLHYWQISQFSQNVQCLYYFSQTRAVSSTFEKPSILGVELQIT